MSSLLFGECKYFIILMAFQCLRYLVDGASSFALGILAKIEVNFTSQFYLRQTVNKKPRESTKWMRLTMNGMGVVPNYRIDAANLADPFSHVASAQIMRGTVTTWLRPSFIPHPPSPSSVVRRNRTARDPSRELAPRALREFRVSSSRALLRLRFFSGPVSVTC